MSKTILMKAGQTSFLVEIDESVEIPANLQVVSRGAPEGVPRGMQPVVDLLNIEREFGQVKDLIIACCSSLFDAIDGIPNKPEKIGVEFGIKLAGEAGFPMVTKASGEANFKVSIEWRKD